MSDPPKPPRQTPATARAYLAAALSGILAGLSRPPIDWGILSLVALVPLFTVVVTARPRRAFVLGFVAGAAYFASLVSWAVYFGSVAVVPFVAVLASVWGAACALIAVLARRGIASPWTTAAVWVVGEGTIARWPLGGFSWGELGYASHDFAALRSLAAIGGVSLVSYVIVVVNAYIARYRRKSSIAALVAIGAAIGLWFAVEPATTPTGTLHIAVVQGNDINRDLTDAEMAAFTLPSKHFALAAGLSGRYDLVVFPESAFHPEQIDDPRITTQLGATARRLHSYVLANGLHDVEGGARVDNRNVLYDRIGHTVATYDKRHLVPFGEWVPWRTTLEHWISALQRIPRDFRPGTSTPIMYVDGRPIATVLCFESAFGYEVRPLIADGAQLIVVSTNNRSYRRSANSAQHVAIGQIRAAETGRALVQAAVSGHSAIVDFRGRVRAETPLFRNGVLTADVVTRRGATLYVRFGEWVYVGSLLALAAALLLATKRGRGVSTPRISSVERSSR